MELARFRSNNERLCDNEPGSGKSSGFANISCASSAQNRIHNAWPKNHYQRTPAFLQATRRGHDLDDILPDGVCVIRTASLHGRA